MMTSVDVLRAMVADPAMSGKCLTAHFRVAAHYIALIRDLVDRSDWQPHDHIDAVIAELRDFDVMGESTHYEVRHVQMAARLAYHSGAHFKQVYDLFQEVAADLADRIEAALAKANTGN